MKALEKEGYETPTPIQAQAIPLVMEGNDLLGIAQTGTGKTAAFSLPILHRLCKLPNAPHAGAVRTLILAPTRELAGQIADSCRTYSQFLSLRIATVYGGVSINRQIQQMRRGCDILVATPGRLIDLLEQKAVNLAHVEILVLDEADQMLDLGFIHALKKILPHLPRERQTLFFSATMPANVSGLAGKFLKNPEKVSVAPESTTAERVEQEVMFVPQAKKQPLLLITLKDQSIDRALVFTRTKHGADRVVRKLMGSGIAAAAIHGNKSQNQREKALAAFKSGEKTVLVATDIAARGIDIDGVSHVINFEIPNVPEQYVHRIGRTARAGRSGKAVSFVAPDERDYLRDIQKQIRQKIPVVNPPEGFESRAADIEDEAEPIREERGDRNTGGRNGRGGRPGNRSGGRPGGRGGRPGGARSGNRGEGRAEGRGENKGGERGESRNENRSEGRSEGQDGKRAYAKKPSRSYSALEKLGREGPGSGIGDRRGSGKPGGKPGGKDGAGRSEGRSGKPGGGKPNNRSGGKPGGGRPGGGKGRPQRSGSGRSAFAD